VKKTSSDEKDGPSSVNKPSALQQQNIATALLKASKYKDDSKEQQTGEEAMAKWIGRTGLPVRTVEDEDFVLMMETIDRRLAVPKKTKMTNLVDKQYEEERQKFKKKLAAARRVSVGIDLWTKRQPLSLL